MKKNGIRYFLTVNLILVMLTGRAMSVMALPFSGYEEEGDLLTEEEVTQQSEDGVSAEAEDGLSTEFEDDISLQAEDDILMQGEEPVTSDISDFPESYRSKLSAISEAHPSWKFSKVELDVSWKDAVKAELEGNRSWIEGSADSEYVDKSSPKDEDRRWYQATKAGVEHFMSPVTYLDEKHIFAFEKTSYDGSSQTKDVLTKLLSGTFMSGKIPDSSMTYADAFMEIGASSKVKASPLYLAARVKQEQGTGTGKLISGTFKGYEGYYNYFNIKANGENENEKARNGLEFASTGSDYERPWNTRYKSLLGGSEYVAQLYIQRGQDCVYFQKFNVVSKPYYNHQYMQNIRAPYSEAATTAGAYRSAGALDNGFVFMIPVFKDFTGEGGGTDPEEEKTAELSSVSFVESVISLHTGESKQLAVAYKPADAGIAPEDLRFVSSDTSVVSIDGFGKLRAEGEGTAVITVSYKGEKSEVSATATVNVNRFKVSFYDVSSNLISVESADLGSRFSEIFPGTKTELRRGPALEGQCFAGWFSKPGGKGLRLYDDFRISSDIDVYPCCISVGSSVVITPVGDYYYTGYAIKPPVDVYCDGEKLKPGKDYKLKYKKNKKPGEAQIVINAKKSRGFTQTVCFNILEVKADEEYFTVMPVKTVAKGKPVYGKPKVYYLGTRLVKSRDYVIDYPLGSDASAYCEPGIYPIKITLGGKYSGTIMTWQKVTKKKEKADSLISLKGADISPVTDFDFDEKAAPGYYRQENVRVTDRDGNTLKRGRDFEVFYQKDSSPGTAVMTVKGIGKYKGTIKKKFKIVNY